MEALWADAAAAEGSGKAAAEAQGKQEAQPKPEPKPPPPVVAEEQTENGGTAATTWAGEAVSSRRQDAGSVAGSVAGASVASSDADKQAQAEFVRCVPRPPRARVWACGLECDTVVRGVGGARGSLASGPWLRVLSFQPSRAASRSTVAVKTELVK